MAKNTVTMSGPAGLIEVSPDQVRRHVALGYQCVEETVERLPPGVTGDEVEEIIEDEVQAELDLEDDEDAG